MAEIKVGVKKLTRELSKGKNETIRVKVEYVKKTSCYKVGDIAFVGLAAAEELKKRGLVKEVK